MFNLKQSSEAIHKPLYFYQSRFFYLLCSLVAYFIGSSFLSGSKTTNFINTILLSFFIIIGIFPFIKQKVISVLTPAVAIVILCLHFTVIFIKQDESIFIALYFACAIFLSLITFAVIYSITQHQRITLDSLFGAICGYFLIGFSWTFFYMVIKVIYPESFPAHMLEGSMHDRTQHFFYFSFSTMTTLGYGDILPLTNVSRTFAWLEAVCGQIYLAVWISQLVGLRIAQEINETRS